LVGGSRAVEYPWHGNTGPHFVLEVTDRCNVACRACYKAKGDSCRPLADLLRDVETARSLRPLQTVSLAGAEPTLHPDLPELVAGVRRMGLRAALITNGVLLDDVLLEKLARAGLDLVMLHIDEGQKRPDLAPHPTAADVTALRITLARRVAAHGMDAGLNATIYPDTLVRLPELVRTVLATPEIGFAFVTHEVDVTGMAAGNGREPATSNTDVAKLMEQEFGVSPYAQWAGGSWISYFIPVVDGSPEPEPVALRPGWLDALLLRVPKWLTGRNMFYCPMRPAMVRLHATLSLLGGGRFGEAARFLARTWGGQPRAKRLVFDGGLRYSPAGVPECGAECPNPTLRNGRLVPVCLADHPLWS
jgi:hypothetical protein